PETPELKYRLAIVVPPSSFAPKPCSYRMTRHTTDAFVKHRPISVQAKIIEVDVPSLGLGQRTDGVYPPEGYARIGRRVEKTGPIQNRLRGERAHGPRSFFPDESDRIECQENIGSFSRIHKAA